MISAQTARRAVWRPLWELPGRSELVLSLARRELVSRYKGSVLGVIWALLTPVVMIVIFTFIFAGIFGARFGVRYAVTGDYDVKYCAQADADYPAYRATLANEGGAVVFAARSRRL